MLKPWYRVQPDGDRVLFEYGHRLVVLEGGAARRLLPALLPLLDGRRTLEEIAASLGEAVAPAIRTMLEALVRAGAVTEGPPLGDDLPRSARETAELLSAAAGESIAPSEAAGRLQGCSVGIAGRAPLAEQIAQLLHRSGIGSLEHVPGTGAGTGWTAFDLAIVAPSSTELDLLDEVNRTALSRPRPWLPILPFDGVLAAIGPLVIPGESACWECVRLRRASAIGYADELPLLERAPGGRQTSPPLEATIAGLAASVALRWLVQRDPALPGHLLALEQWPSPRLTGHTVYRVPRCPTCSELAWRAAPATWSEASAA
jgi:bacteriocin biosynthesis cyclodehydratase domain-containing protein